MMAMAGALTDVYQQMGDIAHRTKQRFAQHEDRMERVKSALSAVQIQMQGAISVMRESAA